jgi:hypothetical protein
MNGRCLCWLMWLGNRTCCIVAIPVVEQVVFCEPSISKQLCFRIAYEGSHTHTTSLITFICLIHTVVSNVQSLYNKLMTHDSISETTLPVKKEFICQLSVVSYHIATVSDSQYTKELNFFRPMARNYTQLCYQIFECCKIETDKT